MRSTATMRSSSPQPLTPRARKATKSLFKELGQVARTINHSTKRVEQTHAITVGVIRELQAAAQGAEKGLMSNPGMAVGGRRAGSPARRPNATELVDLKQQVRNKLERSPTKDEIEGEVKAMRQQRTLEAEVGRRRQAVANRPIVGALEALFDSSTKAVHELALHEQMLARKLEELGGVYQALKMHEGVRDEIFDPVLASREDGSRSVLYQRTAPLYAPRLDLDDNDPAATIGKLACSNGLEVTGHEATALAAEQEDSARILCTGAMKAVRDAQARLGRKKSDLQVAVRKSREMVLCQRRAAKVGKFGSSEARDTNPASRRLALAPE